MASFSDSMRSGWIGRQLRRMFLDAGMTEVAVACHLLIGGHLTHAQQAGTLDPAEVKRWWDDLRDADAAGRFLAGFTAFIVSEKKSEAGTGAARGSAGRVMTASRLQNSCANGVLHAGDPITGKGDGGAEDAQIAAAGDLAGLFGLDRP